MNTEQEILNKDLILTVELEDGTALECKVITSFINETTNKKYVVYTPFSEIEDDEDSVFLYGALFEEKDGEIVLTQATEEKDFEILKGVINELLKQAEAEDAEESEEA